MILHLLAALQSTVPSTPGSFTTVATIMGICNVLGLIIAKIGIQNPSANPPLPFPIPGITNKKFGVPEFLAGMSIGHLLGTGSILGLANLGVL